MKESLTYTGVVSLNLKKNGKTITKKFYNHGETLLFEAYARAMAGYPIDNLIPAYIDIGHWDDRNQTFSSHLRTTVPVVTTLVTKSDTSEGYNYGVPFTRVEAVLIPTVFTDKLSDDTTEEPTNLVQLKCSLQSATNILASVPIGVGESDEDGLAKIVSELPMGAQLILVWDLYVDNKETGGKV